MLASCVLSGIFALLAASAWSVALSPSTWWGMAMVVIAVVQPALGVATWMRVEPILLVFDRPLTQPPSREWRLIMVLTRRLAEVDAQLVGLGLTALGDSLELELARGIARHDPASTRASIDVLLATASVELEPDLRRALEQLSALLAAADEQRARFCAMPVSGWSGMVETNLQLHFGG